MVGTRRFGFMAAYSGVFTIPYCSPASICSIGKLSSSQIQSTFITLIELRRPQTFNIIDSLRVLMHCDQQNKHDHRADLQVVIIRSI